MSAARHLPQANRTRRVRRRDEDGQAQEQPAYVETVITPSEGARLTFDQLQQSPAQEAPEETHFATIDQGLINPAGLQILDQDGAAIVPNTPPDMIPHIHIVNADQTRAQGGYGLTRLLRNLRHRPGWGELWAGVCFSKVVPEVYRAPPPGKSYVAIKKLNKRVVDIHLQEGNGGYVNRDLRFLDEEYIRNVMRVRDRENPYREMSRMDEIGDNIHVLRQVEFLQDEEYFYIIMPYACGRMSLDSALFRPERELDPRDARNFFIQILRILAYLERKGIHHRDLSPDNFIFLEPDRIVVMDLAMSVRIPVDPTTGQRTLIQAMGVFGTPAFMSPEIYNNFEVFDGISADLWSALLILYGMLTNVPLYHLPDAVADISYRFYVVAGGITQNPTNELILEILSDVFDESDEQRIQQRTTLIKQSQAHLGMSPRAKDLFHHFFRISPSERLTLAQVMESDYVRFEDE
ncbi:hypothetical protein ACA910_021953 [Epithemia clementina (nom. ined.)]